MQLMSQSELVRRVQYILVQWNPLESKAHTYIKESEEVEAILQSIDDPSELGKQIQVIYEKSFNQWVPFEKCVEISYKLLALKFTAKSVI